MNVKKLLRGPILYIVLAIIAVWVGSSLITMSGFREVSTQQGLEFLKGGKVAEAKIVDGEQRVDLTLARRTPSSARKFSSTTWLRAAKRS